MGRLTPSFRVVYGEVMDDLRREIRDSFVDLQHKKAFELLYKEAWRPEEAAMGISTLPTVLDKLVMVGNINIRKLIGQVSNEVKARGSRIEDLAERVKSIEEKVGSIDDKIKKLELKKSMGS
jgi:hypothetical protein